MKEKNKERLDTAEKVTHTGSNIFKSIWYAILIISFVVTAIAAVRVFTGMNSFVSEILSRLS